MAGLELGVGGAASRVTVNPSGLAVITTSNVQAALAELDAAVAAGGGGGGSDLLDLKVWNPTTQTNRSTTTSWAALDTTNARISFAAPASGRVLVTGALSTVVGGSGSITVGLLEAGVLVAGTEQVVSYTEGNVYRRRHFAMVLEGLTAGTKTYDLGVISNVAITDGVRVGGRGSGVPGPLIIEARAA